MARRLSRLRFTALWLQTGFRKGICLSVNQSDDSDGRGSITGNVIGAIQGSAGIPTHWLEELKLKDVITEIAGDLFVRFKKYR